MSSHLRLDEVFCNFYQSHPFQSILIALSGGADSVALLHLAHRHQKQYGYRLEALHVHHGIRGEEADRDSTFCETICKNLDIPFHAVRFDIPALAQAEKMLGESSAKTYHIIPVSGGWIWVAAGLTIPK